MDLIAEGAAWFESQRKDFLSVTVAYWPVGALFGTDVKATVGATRWEGVDAAGMVVRMDTKAFFIARSDLPALPLVGDRIHQQEGGATLIYEVIRPAFTDSHWQWGDRSQKLLRIHAALVDTD